MFATPPEINCYNLPEQSEYAKDLPINVIKSYRVVDFITEKLKDQCGYAPTHIWMPDYYRFLMRQNPPRSYDLIINRQTKVFYTQGLLGVHAAYLRPGYEQRGVVQGIFVGYAHPELKEMPECCLWLYPKAHNHMLLESQIQPSDLQFVGEGWDSVA